MNSLTNLFVFAQAAGNPQGGITQMLIMIVPLFAIMYFLMIRPQRKKQKEHEELLKGIKAGDQIMTTAGMFGKVVRVTEKRVTLEIAERVQVEFLIEAIAQVVTPEVPAEK